MVSRALHQKMAELESAVSLVYYELHCEHEGLIRALDLYSDYGYVKFYDGVLYISLANCEIDQYQICFSFAVT